MFKLKNILLGCSSIILITILTLNFVNGKTEIYIENNTNLIINNLELKYLGGEVIETISKIESGESKKYVIDTSELEGENSIYLDYKDSTGKHYSQCIVGYLEKGDSENSNININNVDNNGKLEILVNGISI